MPFLCLKPFNSEQKPNPFHRPQGLRCSGQCLHFWFHFLPLFSLTQISMTFLLSWQQDEHPLSSGFSHLALCSFWNTLASDSHMRCCFLSFWSLLECSVFRGTCPPTIPSNRTATIYFPLFYFIRFIITWQNICLLMPKKKKRKMFIVCSSQ